MIGALRSADGAYDEKIAFIDVDWDDHRRSPIAKKLKIIRQSTLVMFTGKRVDEGEAGRLFTRTAEAEIKGLLDKGLQAKPAGGKPCSGQ